MDRWSIVSTLNYLPHDEEAKIVLAKGQVVQQERGQAQDHSNMVARRRPDALGVHQRRFVHRDEPAHGHHWAENAEIFGDIGFAFRLTFVNSADELERRWWRSSISAASARTCRRVPPNVALS